MPLRVSRLFLDGRAGYLLRFRFSAEDIRILKTMIPPEHRRWVPAERGWWVSPDPKTLDVIRAIFPEFDALRRAARKEVSA